MPQLDAAAEEASSLRITSMTGELDVAAPVAGFPRKTMEKNERREEAAP
jgi:hypothetical protein